MWLFFNTVDPRRGQLRTSQAGACYSCSSHCSGQGTGMRCCRASTGSLEGLHLTLGMHNTRGTMTVQGLVHVLQLQ